MVSSVVLHGEGYFVQTNLLYISGLSPNLCTNNFISKAFSIWLRSSFSGMTPQDMHDKHCLMYDTNAMELVV